MDANNARPQNTNEEQKIEREPLKLEIEAEPFNGIASTKYVTSSDLCRYATELFKGVFADCEGTMFDIMGNIPTLSVIFNHGVYDKDKRVALFREGAVDSSANLIQRYRNRDRLLNNGDRYLLTEDGKDIFRDLLIPQAYNNGKPNWGKVVVEFSENTQQRIYGLSQNPQYTKVGFIDLAKFAALIWGSKDENNDSFAYQFNIVRAMNSGVPGMPPSNYMLMATRVSEKELQATFEKLGFGSFSSIVR